MFLSVICHQIIYERRSRGKAACTVEPYMSLRNGLTAKWESEQSVGLNSYI